MLFFAIENDEDKTKLERLYNKYKSLMYYVAFNILKDKHLAEDAVHQSWVRIISNLHKINEDNFHKTKAFLVIICRNVSYDIYRKQVYLNNNANFIKEAIEKENEDNIDPLEKVIIYDKMNNLISSIKNLKPVYQDVLMLKYFLEYKNNEIAEMLKISPETVRKRIERAKKELYRQLGKEELA